jgi:hypothetical protein
MKSSFGPEGLDKMIVNDVGDVNITNDGATILAQLEIQHPAAKVRCFSSIVPPVIAFVSSYSFLSSLQHSKICKLVTVQHLLLFIPPNFLPFDSFAPGSPSKHSKLVT